MSISKRSRFIRRRYTGIYFSTRIEREFSSDLFRKCTLAHSRYYTARRPLSSSRDEVSDQRRTASIRREGTCIMSDATTDAPLDKRDNASRRCVERKKKQRNLRDLKTKSAPMGKLLPPAQVEAWSIVAWPLSAQQEENCIGVTHELQCNW